MAEYEYNQSPNPGVEDPDTLKRLQDDSNSRPKDGPEQNSSKLSNGDINSAPKYRDQIAAQKMLEILAQKTDGQKQNQTFIYSMVISKADFGPKVAERVATEMAENKIAKEKIAKYDDLSEGEKKTVKDELFKGMDPKLKEQLVLQGKKDIFQNKQAELSRAMKEHVLETIKQESEKGEFGEYSRIAYTAYVNEINKQVNSAAKRIVDQELRFPKSTCPIKLPEDQNGPYSIDRLRVAITTGKVQCKLPDYANDKNSAPGAQERDDLVLAENFLDETKIILSEVDALNQVKAIKDQLTWIFEGKPPAGLMPSVDLQKDGNNIPLARDYVQNALPLEVLLEQVNDHARAISAMTDPQVAGAFDSALLSQLLNNFPGKITQTENGLKIIPDYPKTLADTDENRTKKIALEKWVDKVHQPLQQILKACDFANRYPDRVCYWARVPAHGIDTATGKEYNRIQFRYNAEPVKVQVVLLDGTTGTEDRIKVTTTKQLQSIGLLPEIFGATDIGKPITSGRVTINGNNLDSDGTEIGLKGNHIRLSKDGMVQVKAGNNNSASIELKDASGKTYKLKPGDSKWYDILPGISLSVGNEKVQIHNDTRLYKPTDTIAVKDSYGTPHLARAEELPNRMRMDAASEFMSEAVPVAVDIGFTVTGLLELKALAVAGRRVAQLTAEVVAERAALAAARDLAVRETFVISTAEIGALSNAATFTEEAGLAMTGLTSARASTSVAERLAVEGLSSSAFAATRTSATKHLLLGVPGLLRHSLEDKLNELSPYRLGSWLYTGRGLFMAADIWASTGWASGVGKAWEGMWAASPELIKVASAASPFLKTASAINGGILKLADLYYVPQTIMETKREINLFARTIQDSDGKEVKALIDAQKRLGSLETKPLEHRLAEHLVGLLHKDDREQIQTALNNLSKETLSSSELDVKSNQLANVFLYNGATNQEKLIAALGLLKLRFREDGSLPEVLASEITDGQSTAILTLPEVRSFLANFTPTKFSDASKKSMETNFHEAIDSIAGTLKPTEKDLLIGQTIDALNRENNDPVRQQQINHLANKFKDLSSPSNVRIISGIGLLMLNTDKSEGGVKELLGERQGFYVSVRDNDRDRLVEQNYWDISEETARKLSMSRDEFNEAGSTAKIETIKEIKELVSAPEVIYFLRQELGRTRETPTGKDSSEEQAYPAYAHSSDDRLTVADVLLNYGQLEPEEHGRICLEIAKDPSLNPANQAQSLLASDKHRVAQVLLTHIQRGQSVAKDLREQHLADKARAAVTESLTDARKDAEIIIKNQAIDRNLRALAVATLNATCSGVIPEKPLRPVDIVQRATKLSKLEKTWQSCISENNGKATNKFADSYFKGLVDQLHDKKTQSEGGFQAAKIVLQMNDVGIIALAPAQKQEALNEVMLTLYATEPQGKNPFVKNTRLNISPEKRENARESMGILSSHFKDISDQQKSQLRSHITAILNLPNQENREDSEADPIGESDLKMSALSNIKAIFAQASLDECKSLADSLKKDIHSLSVPSITENNRFRSIHSQLLETEIKELSQLTLSRQENLALRNDITGFLKEIVLAEPLPAQSNIRLGALQALNVLSPVNGLSEICSSLLGDESNIAVREEAENIQKLIGHEDPYVYHTEYLRSKRGIQNAFESVRLTDSEHFLTSDPLGRIPSHLLATDSGKVRLGNNWSDTQKLEILEQCINGLGDRALAGRSTKDIIENVNALAFLMSSGGHPVAAPFNLKAMELAARNWQRLRESDNLEIKKVTAPLSMLLVLHAPALPYPERHQALQEFLNNDIFSPKEKATVLSMVLEQEFHRTPHNIANSRFKESQDYQLAVLHALEPLQTTEQIPLLAAIIDEKPKSSVEKDSSGQVYKVNYPDGGYRSVQIQDGKITALSIKRGAGSEEKWILDVASGNYFRENDLKEKKQPWACTLQLYENGDLVVIDKPNPIAGKGLENYEHSQLSTLYSIGRGMQKSPAGTAITHFGSKTTYTRDGSTILEVPLGKQPLEEQVLRYNPSLAHTDSDFWVQVTYADGSTRSQECDGKGRGFQSPQFKPVVAVNKDDYDELTRSDPFQFPREWQRERPLWFDNLSIVRYLDSTGFDRTTHSFWRTDLSNDGRTYQTKIKTDGSKIMESTAKADDLSRLPGSHIILATAGNDSNAAHPMPLVHEQALSMLAKLSLGLGPEQSVNLKANNFNLNRQTLIERYSSAKLAIESSKNNSLIEFKDQFISQRNEYTLIDAQKRDLYAKTEADKELGYWWLVGYSADYDKASRNAQVRAEQQLRRLQSDANFGSNRTNVTGQQARTALAYLAISDRGPIGQKAIKAIGEICEGNSFGSGPMREIVARDLISEPTIGTASRRVLFESLKTHVARYNTAASQAKAAELICKALEIEYQTMPSELSNPLYKQSESLQVDCIKFLKEQTRYNESSIASVRALSELSPSKAIRDAAGEYMAISKKISKESKTKQNGLSGGTIISSTNSKKASAQSLNKHAASLPKITID